MALISQLLSASYPNVIAKKPVNQWAESALLSYMEKLGMVKRVQMGSTIDVPLDYQINAGAQVLATDMAPTSTTKTEVLTTSQFTPAQISVPIVWSKGDEAMNDEQKVDLVTSLIDNALESHDDLIESNLFAGTNGFVGFDTMITENGEGTIGGIVAATDVWHKNQYKDYGDATTLLADMATLFNSCMKGSGSKAGVKLIVTSATSHGVYEGKLAANQRFVDSSKGDGGFVALAFRNVPVIFSQKYTSDSFFYLSKGYELRVAKNMFRFKDKETAMENAEAYKTSVFTVGQAITSNRSRLGVLFT
jgi:hypothetical protein